MIRRDQPHALLRDRRAGVLLHPTSLPGPGQFGTIGEYARRFVDFLSQSGFTVWQMLPTGPTHDNRSPYQLLSSLAGNPELIDPDDLVARGWLTQEERTQTSIKTMREQAARRFLGSTGPRDAYQRFCHSHRDWLEDYALFMALRAHFQTQEWTQWPKEIRSRRPQAMANLRRTLADAVEVFRFEQFVFDLQWRQLRQYAAERQVALMGDIPIFVAHDSADVWANQNLFRLNADGQPLTVAGVPPDYFSEEGQHWGNPHYNWDEMQASGFRWWRARLNRQIEGFDLVRLDHFRGLQAYWEIPAKTPLPKLGQWVEAPGKALLNALLREHKKLPVVAENLGFITPEVEALRESFHLPGMAVLQFAFDGQSDNPHLPHEYSPHTVVYTGTHDNDTSLGWFNAQGEEVRDRVTDYCYGSEQRMPELLIRLALASVARLAIIPMQDLLGLDGQHRMNTPGTDSGNWRWRFSWDQVPDGLAGQLRHWLLLYGREPNRALTRRHAMNDS